MNPVFNRTAPNILAPHKFCAHNVLVPGAIQSFWALDEFVSSTLLLWWIWRNPLGVALFFTFKDREMGLTLRYFFNKITRFRRYT